MRTITRGHQRGTYVKGKELAPRMVVVAMVGFGPIGEPREVIVDSVVRAADEVERLRQLVAKTKSRAKLYEQVDDLKRALDACDIYGREARIVTARVRRTGTSTYFTASSQDDYRYIGQA